MINKSYIQIKFLIISVDLKSTATDLVTETDKAVEKLIVDGLKSNFPNHKFIGEEGTAETRGAGVGVEGVGEGIGGDQRGGEAEKRGDHPAEHDGQPLPDRDRPGQQDARRPQSLPGLPGAGQPGRCFVPNYGRAHSL